MLKIGILKEAHPEKRVCLLPESVKRLKKRNLDVFVEKNAGLFAGASDEAYAAAGATIVASSQEIFQQTNVIIKIRIPTDQEVQSLNKNHVIIATLEPLVRKQLTQQISQQGATAIAVDAIPRTTLAQMMDVLSSQSTLAGYRAVILGAGFLPKIMPMMMTAAGTLPAAKVLVLGAGVAGLQVIATARRLGATVEAFDVRKVVKEQVESLGAKFVEVDSTEDAQTSGGYAKEVSEEYKRKQADLLLARIAHADLCITTALIPGRPAPKLVTEAMVKAMRSGSVIVDMAAEQGGNCECTRPGEVVTINGVTIVGEINMPGELAIHASQMYSKNLEKLLEHLLEKDNSALRFDMNDEITRGIVTVQQGEITDIKFKGAA